MIQKKRLVQTFLELVQIDSPSGEEKQFAKEMVKRLKKLGGDVEQDSYGNVIAKFAGTGTPIMLNAHLDTVEPGRGITPIIKGDKIVSNGKTILGGDAKAGIAIILEALTSLKEEKKSHIPIEIVLTKEEELSLGGAKNLDYKKISAKYGIVFDGDEHVHNIFVSSPGYYNVDLVITGRGAHAGVEPEKGISAIEIASKIIATLHLGRIDHETTANIGLIQGGSARNAIPEQVHIQGEIRSRNKKTLQKHIAHFKDNTQEIASQYKNATIDLQIYEEFQGFNIDKTHATVQHVTKVLQSLSLTPQYIDSGGGSDANIFYKHGIEVVIVGAGVWEPHTTREYVVISQMVDATRFCNEILTIT